MATPTKKIIHIEDDEPKKVDPPKPVPAKVEPPKPAPPKPVPAKVEPPKPAPPKPAPAKVEPPKPVPPKPVPAKVEPLKPVPAKVEPPKPVAPKVEPPKPVAPKVEPPKPVAPKVEPPKPDPPKVEPPKPVAPKTEPPIPVPVSHVANLGDLIDKDDIMEVNPENNKPKRDVISDKIAQSTLIQKLTDKKEDADSETIFNGKVRTLLKERGSKTETVIPKEVTAAPVKDIARILLRLEKIPSRNNRLTTIAGSRDRRPPTGRANNKVSTGRSEF